MLGKMLPSFLVVGLSFAQVVKLVAIQAVEFVSTIQTKNVTKTCVKNIQSIVETFIAMSVKSVATQAVEFV